MLKKYQSIRDIVRDLRRVKKSSRQLIAAVNEDEELSGKKPAMITQHIRVPGTVKMPDAAEAPSRQLSVNRQQSLTQEGKRYTELLEQQKNINHIINSLNTEFAGEKNVDIAAMQKLARRVSNNINKSLEQAKVSATESSRKVAPKILMTIAKKVAVKLDDRLGNNYSKHEIVALSNIVQGETQHTIYLVYHDLQDDEGNTSEQNVFAITMVAGKTDDQLYINPALHTVKILSSKFMLGREVPITPSDQAKMVNTITSFVNRQLDSNKMEIEHNALPVPTSIDRNKLKSIHPAISDSKVNGRVLEIKINNTIKNKAQAEEIIGQIYRVLYSSAITVSPKIRINRSLKELRKDGRFIGWLARFVFLPTGKISGRTLGDEMINKLREIGLLDKEISKIRYLIEGD